MSAIRAVIFLASVSLVFNASAQVASYSIDASVTSGSPAIAGTTIQFSLSANNEGPADALNVVVQFNTPANTTFVSLTPPPGWSCTTPAPGGTGPVSCSTPDLAPGSEVHFLAVTTPSNTPRGTLIQLDASITSTTTDQSTNDNAVTVTVPVDWVSALAVTKSAPASATAGTAFTYTFAINNSGPSSAGDLTFTDVLPAGALFNSITAPGWSCATPAAGANGTVTCTIAEIPTGTTSLALSVTAAPSTPSGTNVLNTATVDSTTDPQRPRTSNTTSTAITTSADLTISKTAPATVFAGDNFTYSILVADAGPSDAQSLTLNDPLPAGVRFQSISAAGWSCTTPAVGASGTVNCTMASLASGANSTVTITVSVPSAATSGTAISNTATVTSTTADPSTPNTSTTSSTVQTHPKVSATKSTVGSAFFETQTVTYKVVLTNSGSTIQTDNPGDEMTDVLPSALTLVSASATSGTAVGDIPNNTVHWNGSIAGNGSVTITIVASIHAGTAGTTISNTATTHYDADGNGTNETAGTSNTVVFSPQPVSAIPAMPAFALAALAAMLALLAAVKLRA